MLLCSLTCVLGFSMYVQGISRGRQRPEASGYDGSQTASMVDPVRFVRNVLDWISCSAGDARTSPRRTSHCVE